MSRKLIETRNRILSAALELMMESQGTGVRMADVAAKAGISRQALYLHFGTRAELLIATTFYLDELKGSEERLAASRAAPNGPDRLDAYIEAWGNYIPEIYGVAKAFLAMSDTDEAATSAWAQRMQDMREGCEAAIVALDGDGLLTESYTLTEATDLLWTLLSVRNWEQLTKECGWTQEAYIRMMKSTARSLLMKKDA